MDGLERPERGPAEEGLEGRLVLWAKLTRLWGRALLAVAALALLGGGYATWRLVKTEDSLTRQECRERLGGYSDEALGDYLDTISGLIRAGRQDEAAGQLSEAAGRVHLAARARQAAHPCEALHELQAKAP